jgi:non-heme chloroperoxidase
MKWIWGNGLIVCIPLLVLSAVSRSETSQIADGFITTGDSVRIHYLDSGVRTGAPTLVLIPGWRFPATIWKPQIDSFSKRARVIAIDPRSQGESTKTSEANTPEVRARDLHELIKQLALERVVLVGWSQGVQDVAAYAAQFGMDKVSGIVLVDSYASVGPAEVELHQHNSEQELELLGVLAEHPVEYARGMMGFMFKRKHDEAYLNKLVDDILKTPTSTAVAMLVADRFTTDRRPALGKLTRPTLVVAAADSPEIDAEKEMAKSISNCQFVTMENVGHALFADDPEQFNQLLETFLEGISTAH